MTNSNVVGGGADDRLSRCASALLALAERKARAYAELNAYHAPSECALSVRRSFGREALRTLALYGYTQVDFERELEQRTCVRFVDLDLGGLLIALLPSDGNPDRRW